MAAAEEYRSYWVRLKESPNLTQRRAARQFESVDYVLVNGFSSSRQRSGDGSRRVPRARDRRDGPLPDRAFLVDHRPASKRRSGTVPASATTRSTAGAKY